MQNKIDKNLLNLTSAMENKNEKVDCLVYANNYNFARKYLKNIFGDIVEYPFIKAFGINADIKSITKIARLTQVSYISSTTKVFAQMDITKKVMNIQNVQDEYTGEGINIAVIDTGLAPHFDFCSFENRILHFEDFISGKTEYQQYAVHKRNFQDK